MSKFIHSSKNRVDFVDQRPYAAEVSQNNTSIMSSAEHNSCSPDHKFVEVCRLMMPDDANNSGNVHGGVILKMIEEAGAIITTRHCNKNRDQSIDPCMTALARVERTDFLKPMFIGEVAQLHAEISYTSEHSLEVQVIVWAENILDGSKRLTNRATLWYVPLSMVTTPTPNKVVPTVPKMIYTNPEAEEQGRKRYENQKDERDRFGRVTRTISYDIGEVDMLRTSGVMPYSVPFSQSNLVHLVGPSDCAVHGYCKGGVTMKLMDECAGIVACRHCRTQVVTASLDVTNFHKPVKKGSVLSLTGIPTFTSNKSMEIEVLVDVEYIFGGETHKDRAVNAFFTFVSLGPGRKTQQIPALKVHTQGEKLRFQEGKKRYEARKAIRMKARHQASERPVIQQTM
ncbi:putative cytosolic acyl coenzyme A thioester hydrolase-like [Saccoglossus kowalevskii]|uniref:Cytosolic acyl coenzyme A thioester hydrolase-like n=1 Tax=Saccoglossus kowalevskii TaxID=10224 RepID=A0ABM0LW79_SACKO|nr:PREDICTED: cytosolic acyl coenzyme A thioester hydrolase-like [Saccoglossus kowalevskii]